jgi:hypothetical protein
MRERKKREIESGRERVRDTHTHRDRERFKNYFIVSQIGTANA